jgi:hypothetical protein
MGKVMVVVSCVGMLFFFSYVNCDAFRCGDGFVSVGDSKTKVLLECGNPTSKEKVGVKKDVGEKTTDNKRIKHKKKDKEYSKESRATIRGEYQKVSRKTVEKWYYNCGDNDFIYVLTFEGGKLKREDTEGYGKGKSDCKGR